MRKKSLWLNKKQGKTPFKGSYERDAKGERNFILTKVVSSKSKKERRITFESPQAAKAQGWVKL